MINFEKQKIENPFFSFRKNSFFEWFAVLTFIICNLFAVRMHLELRIRAPERRALFLNSISIRGWKIQLYISIFLKLQEMEQYLFLVCGVCVLCLNSTSTFNGLSVEWRDLCKFRNTFSHFIAYKLKGLHSLYGFKYVPCCCCPVLLRMKTHY